MDNDNLRGLRAVALMAVFVLLFMGIRVVKPYLDAMESAVQSYLGDFSWSQPVLQSGPEYVVVLIVALAVGAGLALLCQLMFGEFRVWGFSVGLIGTHLLWIIGSVLAAKYGALLLGALAYLFRGFRVSCGTEA